MQTIPIIDTKISQYTTGNDYQPLMVQCKIVPPLYLSNPWLYFDGILSYLCMRDALQEEFWSIPSNITIDISNLQLPLKKTEDVYHASVGIMNKPVLKKNTIFKRFTDKETYHLTKKQQGGKIRTNAGHYKDFMINLPLIITDNIKWYCNGDKKSIRHLLKHLTNLGKKTSIGGGYIKNIKITETETDYSFYKDGYVLKPTPSTLDHVPVIDNNNMKWSRCTYKDRKSVV